MGISLRSPLLQVLPDQFLVIAWLWVRELDSLVWQCRAKLALCRYLGTRYLRQTPDAMKHLLPARHAVLAGKWALLSESKNLSLELLELSHVSCFIHLIIK